MAGEYPRPQMTRDASTYTNLNGLWEFALAKGGDPIPFGQTLSQTILVPFPLEACLSGAFAWPTYSKYFFYRLLFDAPAAPSTALPPITAVTGSGIGELLSHHRVEAWIGSPAHGRACVVVLQIDDIDINGVAQRMGHFPRP